MSHRVFRYFISDRLCMASETHLCSLCQIQAASLSLLFESAISFIPMCINLHHINNITCFFPYTRSKGIVDNVAIQKISLHWSIVLPLICTFPPKEISKYFFKLLEIGKKNILNYFLTLIPVFTANF